MRLRIFRLYWFAAILWLLSSCSNTRFLKENQLLYTGITKVNITDKENLRKNKPAADVIDALTFYKPNNALFGSRRVLLPVGLWANNYLKPKNENKKGSWLYRNLKKEPILISTVNPELRCRHLETALFARGFFHVKASYEIKISKKNSRKAKIAYTVSLGQPFIINKIIIPKPQDSIDLFLNNYIESFNIDPGDVFSLEAIQTEKSKMAALLTEQGYFFFGPGYLDFIADTAAVPYQVNLMIRKNADIPQYVLKKYSIDAIKVTFPVSAEQDETTSENANDSVFYDGISIVNLNNYLKPEALRRCIQFKSGDMYSQARHHGTIKQFNNYGVFRNVKVRYVISDTAQQKLNMLIELMPKDNINLNLEGYVQTKSSGFAGPGLEGTLANGNIGRAANTLQLKLTGGFEWQLGNESDQTLGTNSYNAGINSAFVFPKFILPFNLPAEKTMLSSKTICDLGFEFLNNVRYYRMTSITAGYSYQWKKRQKITNKFSPVKVNIVNLLETTAEFDSIVESNIYVKKSFEEQTILGMEYSFIYDNTLRKSNGIYFQAIVSTSGNAATLIKSAGSESKPYTILNNVYSQFLKTSFDIRYYTRTSKKGLAFRYYTGFGYSYGNSTVMPYIEQFYSGGSTSIRGFAARSLGPGSYKPEEQNGIIDQTGDIKLEFNVEYRVPLSDLVHTALFADIGNVWLLNEDVNRPGAEFDISTFTKQLAVGAGTGLRFDFDFFVLRTDLGFPLRNTYASETGYWLKDISDVISGYRFNIAIGYPF